MKIPIPPIPLPDKIVEVARSYADGSRVPADAVKFVSVPLSTCAIQPMSPTWLLLAWLKSAVTAIPPAARCTVAPVEKLPPIGIQKVAFTPRLRLESTIMGVAKRLWSWTLTGARQVGQPTEVPMAERGARSRPPQAVQSKAIQA